MLELKTPQDWEAALQSARPVLVLFWAPWCGSANLERARSLLHPFLSHFAGKVVFASLNVDELPGIALRHGAHHFPTFVVLSAGKPAGTCHPEQGSHELSRLLYRLLMP